MSVIEVKTNLTRATDIATLVVAGCAVIATASLFGGFRGQRPVTGAALRDTIPVEKWQSYLEGGHVRGPGSAAVTILEFGDYECPFCARFAATMDKIHAAFPTQVRLVYRHWPLPNHRFAYPAARAAECAADQGRFWAIHDLMYAKRDSLGVMSFASFGRQAGVPDTARFDVCITSSEPIALIEDGINDARDAGGRGTPTIIVNGLLIRTGVDSAYIATLLLDLEKR